MAARFGRVVIDVGAGDGGYAVHRARGEPNTFAIAIDASPDALSDGAWRAHRLRLSNVAFLVTAVEQLPGALDETADEITVHFPWGSLLRGMLAADSSLVGRLAGSLRTEGELRLLVSAVERDGYSKVTPARLLELAPRYEALGLDLVESGWATPADIARSRSSWAKRLGPRPAVLAIFRRHPRIHSQSRSTQVGPGMAGNLDSEGRHSVSAGGQIRMCHPEVPPGTPVPDVRSEETPIPLGSESMPALVAFPEHTPAPAILVINDISGRSPFYDHLADRHGWADARSDPWSLGRPRRRRRHGERREARCWPAIGWGRARVPHLPWAWPRFPQSVARGWRHARLRPGVHVLETDARV